MSAYVLPAHQRTRPLPLTDADYAMIETARRPTTTARPAADVPVLSGAISIRQVATQREFRACVDLQVAVWGAAYTDIVPASLLQVVGYTGGLVLGAFTADDTLVGFLFGLTGPRNGEIVHWSHMLGVHDAARNLGVGRRLKEAQRAALAAMGVRRISWSFDPLVAKNAFLNFNRLGARVTAYVPNMYGASTSDLHLGLDTDRLVVECESDAPSPGPIATNVPYPVLTREPRPGDLPMNTASQPATFWIEVPSDISQVRAQSPSIAVSWRDSVRQHLQWGLAHGYGIAGLHREALTSRSFYVLQQRDIA